MTNKEKAEELTHLYMNSILRQETERKALEMAEWKDSQFQEELDKVIDSANTYYDKKLNQNMLYRNLGKIELLSKLLNIEFPYNRLHMNFTTMG